MPLNNPPVVTLYTSGEYAGDNGDDRAIPHGLRAVPSIVLIKSSSSPAGMANKTTNVNTFADSVKVVTIADSVNFYVSQTTALFNQSGLDYSWVAFA